MEHTQVHRPVARLAGITTLLIALLALVACGAPATEPAAETEDVSAPAEEPTDVPVAGEPEADPEPFATYTDVTGREVVLDAMPESIVSLAPSLTESLFAIGAGDAVVARTEYCNYPPEVESLPTIGGFSADSMSIEAIVALEPDLVVGGINHTEVAATLEDQGITVLLVEPASVADIMDTLLTLGAMTGHADQAQAVVDDMQARIDAVTAVVAEVPEDERPTVFYEVWHEPLMTTTNATFIGELIGLAGGVNVFAELEEQYPVVSAEEIIASNPDVIMGPDSHGDQLNADVILSREGWDSITAAQNEAFVLVDGDMVSRPGPRVVDSLEVMAAGMYPDLFGE